MMYKILRNFSIEELKGRGSDFFIYIVKDIIDEAKIKYGANIDRLRFTLSRWFYEEMRHRLRCEMDYIRTSDFNFEVEYDMYYHSPHGTINGIPFKVDDICDTPFIRLTFEVCDPIFTPAVINNRFKREQVELKWDQAAIIDDKKVKETLNRIYGLVTEDKSMKIREVIFHNPATIVYWGDGTKTVVKCGRGETFDKEKGLAMAVSKKVLGTNKTKSNYNDIFKKWCKED